MAFSLYELSADYLSALDALAESDMPADAIADTLEGMAGEWEEKALNVARFIRNLEAERDAISEASKQMKARMEAADAKASRLREYLARELERTRLKPKAPDLALRIQKNPPSVVIEDEFALPDGFVVPVISRKIDKTAIKNAIQGGQEVPGARLEQSTRLVIQ